MLNLFQHPYRIPHMKEILDQVQDDGLLPYRQTADETTRLRTLQPRRSARKKPAAVSGLLRRGRDSNPGTLERVNGFRDRPVRPLRHLSYFSACCRGSLCRKDLQRYIFFSIHTTFFSHTARFFAAKHSAPITPPKEDFPRKRLQQRSLRTRQKHPPPTPLNIRRTATNSPRPRQNAAPQGTSIPFATTFGTPDQPQEQPLPKQHLCKSNTSNSRNR